MKGGWGSGGKGKGGEPVLEGLAERSAEDMGEEGSDADEVRGREPPCTVDDL